MNRTLISHLTNEELLREVEARNVLDPLTLELAARLEKLLARTPSHKYAEKWKRED